MVGSACAHHGQYCLRPLTQPFYCCAQVLARALCQWSFLHPAIALMSFAVAQDTEKLEDSDQRFRQRSIQLYGVKLDRSGNVTGSSAWIPRHQGTCWSVQKEHQLQEKKLVTEDEPVF